ncbi:MAG: hypothetical protein WA988_00420 [Candidatus Nanopelagicales bacterium]
MAVEEQDKTENVPQAIDDDALEYATGGLKTLPTDPSTRTGSDPVNQTIYFKSTISSNIT